MARQARQLAGIGASDLATQAAIEAYVGMPRELIVGLDTVRYHDGQTRGGVPLSRRDEVVNSTRVLTLVVEGTQDGNPSVDQRAKIQAAWDAATVLGLALLVTPGDKVNGRLDVRINSALRGSKNNAFIIFDKRVVLHGYFNDFVGTTYDISDATISTSVGIYFGPPPGSPVATYISDVGVENLTFVYHPPVNGQGVRVPSLNTFMAVYIDRCRRPRARFIDVSGLNAGFGFAFASCRDIDFDGITVHDCDMVLDATATDPANQNKQLTGINADDFWAGRGIDPTIGGSVRNVRVYNLTSNRATKQVDGVTDQGSRGVVWLGGYISGCDEGVDTYGTGSIYSSYIFADCTCPTKVGHGSYDVVINAKAVGGNSAANGGRAAVLVFAGNRRNTSKVSINLDISDFRGTRLVEVNSDNPNVVAANGSTITTKVEDLTVNVTARNCRAARVMTEGGTGTGNVYSIDIDDASVSASIAEGFTSSATVFMQASQNPASRVNVSRGANRRPIAATAAAARSQGATYSSGYYDQQNGNLISLASWAELDLVHGQSGTGLLRRAGAGSYTFTDAPPLTKAIIAPAAASGTAVRAIEASNPTNPAAGNAVIADFTPSNLPAGLRCGQLAFTDNTGGNAIRFSVSLSNGDSPIERLAVSPQGDLQMGGSNSVISSLRHFVPRSYTVATLPVAGTGTGEIAFASNAKALASGGTLETGAATGALVQYLNGAWRIAGTNIQATA